MYRDKRGGGGGGGGGSKAAAEMSHVTDRKKLNVALDKHLDRSSPSTSTTTTRGLAAKDPRLSMYKSKENHKASRSSAPDENKNSDGLSSSPVSINLRLFLVIFIFVCVFVESSSVLSRLHCSQASGWTV